MEVPAGDQGYDDQRAVGIRGQYSAESDGAARHRRGGPGSFHGIGAGVRRGGTCSYGTTLSPVLDLTNWAGGTVGPGSSAWMAA